MQQSKKILFGLIGLILSITSLAQNISNKGKDFWVGYGHHQFFEPVSGGGNTQNMTLYISVEGLPAGVPYATVVITIDSSGLTPALWWKRTYQIPANTVLSLDNNLTPAVAALSYPNNPASNLWGPLPKGPIDGGGSTSNTNINYDCRLYTDPCPAGTGGFGLFRKKGVHITSDYDIVAYAHTYGSASSGACMLLPTNSWGYSYTTINSNQNGYAGSYNYFYVLAKDDNTKVRITASQAPRTGSCYTAPTALVPFEIVLNKGQIYQYIGQADASGNGVELTASKVESIPNSNGDCKKIAVFAGSSRTGGETGGGCTASSKDNDMQQCFPEHTWGKTYLTAPFSTSSSTTLNPSNFAGCVYKIVSKDTGTIVRINGGTGISVPIGSAYKFANSTSNYIEANKPIMVAQFMTSGNCGTGTGDPAVIYLSPIDQAIPRVGFYKNTKETIYSNYVTLIVPDSGLASLRIDGILNPFGGNSYVTNHQNKPGYKVVVKGWNGASAKGQTLITCNARFNAITYGLGSVEGYGYSGGAYFNNISGKGGQFNVNDTLTNIDSIKKTNHPFVYSGSATKMRILASFKPVQISWPLSRSIDTNIVTIFRTSDGARNRDTIDLLPKPIDSLEFPLGSGKYTDYKYEIPGTYKFVKKTAATANIIDSVYVPVVLFSLPETGIPASCTGSGGALGDTVFILFQVYPSPKGDFIYSPPPCAGQAATFTGKDSSINNPPFKYPAIKWIWSFNGGPNDTGKIKNVILNNGWNTVRLITIFQYGGIDTITRNVFVDTSSVKFGLSSPAVCLGQSITVTDSTISTLPKDSCYWDFGDGTKIIDRTCSPQTHTYTANGTYTIKHSIVITGATCPRDTISKTVLVNNKAYVNFNNPTACIDTSGVANFSYNGPPGITSFKWKFGEPSSGALDSSSVDPTTHKYATEGIYAVKLSVLNSTGCAGDTTKNVEIKISPNIYFNTLTNLCVNSASTSFATKAGCYNQPRVGGYGKFRGNGTDSAGNFNPSTAGVGTHTIWYIYKSGRGCTDSLSRTITVHPKPKADFDYPKTCLPKSGVAQFSNLSSIQSPGTLKSFYWDFNDPNATASNPNVVDSINPSHIFKNTGTYNVKLIDTSFDGCIGDTTITITFSVTPDVQYTALASVCENQTNINVANASVVNGVLGSGNYYGAGTTTAGIFSPGTAGWGTHPIKYVFTSTGNCKDSATQNITVNAKPKIYFNYPAGCLPSNGVVNFVDTSKMPDGQTVANCIWTFGDPNANASNPNTSNVCSPSHTYQYGTYTIYHSVTSNLGCISDTTFNATFNISPALYYNAIPSVCETVNSHSVAYAGSNNLGAAPGNGVYNGPGVTNNSTGVINPSLLAPGTYTIWYVFSATSGCKDSISQSVTIKARPRGQFTFTPNTGCLDTTGKVDFTAAGITVPGSTISQYNWQFETPSPVVNGMTPSHNYNSGTFTISLNVQAANGCSFDTAQTQTFNKLAALTNLVQAPVCENGGVITIAAPTVTNGATGSGVFSSFNNAFTNTTTGTYDPSISKYGVDTIYYTFTATGGCITVKKAVLTIKARPRGQFTFTPNTGCLDTTGKVDFTAAGITVPGSTISQYNWQFETPSPVVNGMTPSHNYNSGTFTISLNVQAANGCSFDTAQTQTFNKLAALTNLVQAPVCENGGVITIAAPTVTNGATGSGVFSSFKNAFTNTTTGTYDPSISKYGVDTIYYTFTATGGCITVKKAVLTIKARPRGQFTFTPNTGCLDTTGKVDFTAAGITVPGSTISQYNWQFETPSPVVNGMTPSHNYNSGTFTISLNVQAANGCSFDTAQTQTFNKLAALTNLVQAPVCENGGVITIAAPTVTNGATGSGVFSSFKNAFTNTTTGTYDPSISKYGVDTIYYTFTATGGCVTVKKAVLTINARPRGQFTFTPNTGCLDTTGKVDFTAAGITVPGSTISQYNWQFETPSPVVNGMTPSHNYNSGTFTISLNVQAANGCSFDTAQTQTFNKLAALTNLVQAPVCENGGVITIAAPTVTNGATGSGVFSSFKNAFTNTTTGTYDPSISKYGVDTIYYTFTATGGCITVKKAVLTINARPRGQFTFTPNTGCLDTTGKVDFTAAGITVPGSTINQYNWQFETPSPVVNGMTPSHNYNSGTFTISLNVQAANGCSFDTAQTQTFNRTPALSNLNLASICDNSGIITIAAPTVTNGVPGTGLFSSFKNAFTNTTTGTYNPSIAGGGVDTIYYTFTGAGGCSATVKQALNISASPVPIISVQSNVCIDSTARFNDNSTISSGTITTRTWNFGDGTPNVVNPPGNTVVKGFATVQTYTVKLTVQSNSGCVKTDSTTITVRPKPVANFDFTTSVCMPNGTVNFTNNSVIAANGGTLAYDWNFGDPFAGGTNPNTSTATSPSHTYTNIQNYPVRLVANSSFGCTAIFDDTLKAGRPFYVKPIAKFGVSKDTLCENELSMFTDSSSAPGSNLLSWTWNYGDGSSPKTTTVPFSSYSYQYADTFNVRLTVRNTENCISDPYTIKVTVYPQPKIDSLKDIIVLQNTVMQLLPKINDTTGINFWWTAALPPYNTNDLSNSNIWNPYLTANQTQIYVLNALGKGSCTAQRSVFVKVLGTIIIPNAFSPNGDGVNDYWDIKNLADYPGATLNIFDRYGTLVKSLTGQATRWDGTRGGTPVPVGTYYYVIDPGFKQPKMSGWVLIIR
jgi:gliding motility-associated-like protein